MTNQENQKLNEDSKLVLLTEKEFSKNFNINQTSLRLSRQTGLLWGVAAPKYLKIGSRVRYRLCDIEDWFNQFEVVGNTSQANQAKN